MQLCPSFVIVIVTVDRHPPNVRIRLAENHPSPQASFLVEAGTRGFPYKEVFSKLPAPLLLTHCLLSRHLRQSIVTEGYLQQMGHSHLAWE